MRSALAWIVAMVTLCSSSSACGGDDRALGPVPPYLTMLTEHASYDPGDVATVRLINHHHEPLLYYGCDVILEVLTQSGWRRAPMANLPCIDRLIGIAASSEGTMHHLLPDDTATGIYRVRFERIRISGKYAAGEGVVPDEQLSTNVFAVQ
jgi:hypothetical protein